MKCPNCEEKLQRINLKGVQVEECTSCDGMWFGRDELRKAKDNTDKDLQWLDFEIFEDKESKYSKNFGDRICPKDFSFLKQLIYADSKIKIDACPQCKGIWLDSPEFKKIITYLENKVVTTTSGEYAKASLQEFIEILNGPESLAEEVRDFLSVVKLAETRLGAEHPIITHILFNFPIR